MNPNRANQEETMRDIPLQTFTEIVPLDNWQDYLRDGKQFLGVARRAYTQKRRTFTTEILYNLVAMGIEKLVMAFLMKNGDLAENHTMGDLFLSLQKHLGDLPGYQEDFRFLDSFQEICDLAQYTRKIPDSKEMSRILVIGNRVELLLSDHF